MFFTSQPEWQNGYTHLEKKMLANLLDASVVSVGFFSLVISSLFCVL